MKTFYVMLFLSSTWTYAKVSLESQIIIMMVSTSTCWFLYFYHVFYFIFCGNLLSDGITVYRNLRGRLPHLGSLKNKTLHLDLRYLLMAHLNLDYIANRIIYCAIREKLKQDHIFHYAIKWKFVGFIFPELH